jgi:cytochrome b6-f complex iron-sulfur subunit
VLDKKNKIMKRREFIPRMIGGSAIVAALPLVMTSCEEDDPDPIANGNNGNNNGNGDDKTTIDLDDPNFVALNSDGGFAYKDSYIVINTGDENFVALSSRCTHSGCTVNYSAASNNLPCPCHGSLFAINGSVLNGPASSNLSTFTVEREDNILTIS